MTKSEMTPKKLKIILVNYRFFVSGGPERYMFNVINLLQRNGHEVIPFSIKHTRNKHSDYESYFMSPVGKGDEVYAKEYKKNDLKTVVTALGRMLYSFEAKKRLEILIKDVKPDLIYVLHYQNKISASIFDAAVKYNIPVVNRISDFGQICANSLLFRPKQKDVCERCIHGSKWNAVKYKCVNDSYVYSAIKATSLVVAERVVKINSKINAFVVPSAFTVLKLAEYGIDRKKLHHIPTFFNSQTTEEPEKISYQPFALYLGRIVQEKGLLTLIKAFFNTSYNLKIIGFTDTDYHQELEDFLKDKPHNIEFLGGKSFKEIIPYLQTCAFTIVPSENYDNFPNTVLESFAYKKAVIATNLGSLKETVINEVTGLLFKQQDFLDLQEKIAFLFANPALCELYGSNAYHKLWDEYSDEKHYQKLMNVFLAVVNKEEIQTKVLSNSRSLDIERDI
ncbi:MAG: glycosyltransferase family 4 protein [Ferruginibacter sp.]